MKGLYYSIKMYIEEYPREIDCSVILRIADQICELLQCDYEALGYSLLHPDYDYKNLGKEMKKSPKNKEKFANLQIPLKYYGEKEKFPAAPTIIFDVKCGHYELPHFSIELDYPSRDDFHFVASVHIYSDLLKEQISISNFKKIQQIFLENGYKINAAFSHCYFGNMRRVMLSGIECGFYTITDWRIMNHAINYRLNWKNKVLDVFSINAIKKAAITTDISEEIRNIVGENNFIEDEELVIFKLPQSLPVYLLNRFIPTYSRKKIKNILQKGKLCDKDMSVIKCLLKW